MTEALQQGHIAKLRSAWKELHTRPPAQWGLQGFAAITSEES